MTKAEFIQLIDACVNAAFDCGNWERDHQLLSGIWLDEEGNSYADVYAASKKARVALEAACDALTANADPLPSEVFYER